MRAGNSGVCAVAGGAGSSKVSWSGGGEASSDGVTDTLQSPNATASGCHQSGNRGGRPGGHARGARERSPCGSLFDPQLQPIANCILVPKWDHARITPVRIIALSTLKGFLNRSPSYADARQPTMAWYRQVKAANWSTPTDLKRDIGTASILRDGRAVFNVAGNKYRIVAWINYHHKVVYVRFIGTHEQYDMIDAQTI